jgi:hypothetical protein
MPELETLQPLVHSWINTISNVTQYLRLTLEGLDADQLYQLSERESMRQCNPNSSKSSSLLSQSHPEVA